MNTIIVTLDDDAPAARPFALMRDRVLPAIEKRRAGLEAMYSPLMGRPEADPVRLMAVTVLQIMTRLPDRACAETCLYDARWRLALGDTPGFHPTTLVNFRNRLAESGKARLALESFLESMRGAGYLKSCKAVRIDSTHLLARITDMSRHEYVRECPPPDEVFADAGCVSAPALLKAEAGGHALTGPMPASPHSGKRFGTDSFAVDLPGRAAVCPAGNASSECDRINDARYAQYGVRYYFVWPAKTCAACPRRERCVSK